MAYKDVLEKCSKVFSPKLKKISSKSKFFAATQVRGESLTDYAVRLKTLALRCGFGANMDQNLLDKFISGIANSEIKFEVIKEECNTH